MVSIENRAARYEVISETDGNRYRFFCEQSGMVIVTTRPIRAPTPEAALRLAWETEGRGQCNRCECCGKWVSDAMFNPGASACVLCAPWT